MLRDNLENILLICANEFDVAVDEVKSNSRKQELVYCRKAFCIVIKEEYDIKLEIIANILNRSINAISLFVNNQPENKYYKICLSSIRLKVKVSFK